MALNCTGWLTREDALLAADVISICRGKDALFVIGGEKMYSLFDELVDRVYLTEVFERISWRRIFQESHFRRNSGKYLKEEDHGKNYYEGDDYSYRFSIFQRRERRNRYAFVSKFFTDNLDKFEMLKNQVRIHKKNVDEYVQRCLEI